MKWVERLARFMAILGGAVLIALIIIVTISVIGRGLNTFGHSAFITNWSQAASDAFLATGVGPILGDFELVEMGVAFSVFAFLPVCQYFGMHATVDVFTTMLGPRANRWIAAVWEIALTAIIILITARLFAGLQNKYAYGETTFLLQMPVWWSYAASFAAAVVASIVALYCAIMRLAEAITGATYLPTPMGADH